MHSLKLISNILFHTLLLSILSLFPYNTFHMDKFSAAIYSFNSNFYFLIFFFWRKRIFKKELHCSSYYLSIDQNIPLYEHSQECELFFFRNDIHLIQYHDNNADWNVSIYKYVNVKLVHCTHRRTLTSYFKKILLYQKE